MTSPQELRDVLSLAARTCADGGTLRWSAGDASVSVVPSDGSAAFRVSYGGASVSFPARIAEFSDGMLTLRGRGCIMACVWYDEDASDAGADGGGDAGFPDPEEEPEGQLPEGRADGMEAV